MPSPSEEIRRNSLRHRIRTALDRTFTDETWDDQDYDVWDWKPRTSIEQMLTVALDTCGRDLTADGAAGEFRYGGDECSMRLTGTTLHCTRRYQRSPLTLPEESPTVDFTVEVTSPQDIEDAVIRILYPSDGDYAPRHLDVVRDAAHELDAAHAERDAAIHAAKAAGVPIKQIAEAAGMTRQSIYTILGKTQE